MRAFLPLAVASAAITVMAWAGQAHAAGSQVSSTGKGITGGALLGAEAVMLTEGVIGVRPWWAYAIGGGVGAIGGGIGGYFTEQGDPKLPFYLFMGGMALALPTAVVVLDATKFRPVNYTEDQPPADEPAAEPAAPEPAPSETTPSEGQQPTGDRHDGKSRKGDLRARVVTRQKHDTRPTTPALPPAALDVVGGTVSIAVPAVEVRHVYTRTEIATLGVKQATWVHVPVLNVVF